MKNLALRCLAGAAAFSGLTSGLLAQLPCPCDTLQLSEVRFSPLGEDAQFVELVNTGTEPLEIAGVTLLGDGGTYTIPATLTETMGPDDVVIIQFDGADPATDDVSFSGDNLVALHAPADFLGNPVGFVAVYRVEGITTADLLIDFVAWGDAAGDLAADAVAAGIWPDEGIYLLTNPDALPDGPGFIVMSPGDTICRIDNGPWEICRAADASPGATNTPPAALPPPVLHFPNDGLASFDAPSLYWWSAVPGAGEYEIQVSTDADFLTIVFEGTTAETTFAPTADVPDDSTIYWRVRSVRETLESAWSAVFSFTIGAAPAGPSPSAADDQSSVKPKDPSVSPLEATFSVSGTIRDVLPSTGGAKPPLGGVTVTINGINAVTAANGTFTVAGLMPGTYPVTLSLANYTFPNNLMVTVVDSNVTGLVYEGTGASHTIQRGGSGLTPLGARKDTTILATRRGATSNVMCERANTNQQGWDVPHSQASIMANHLESWWCWAVGIVMVNNYYGGTLTRDETVIQVRGDLLHDRDAGSSWGQYIPGLQWAFQQGNLSNFDVRNRAGQPNITTAEVKAWLDANRPLYFRRPGHIMVIDQYLYWGGNLWARFVNTDNDGGTALWQFTTVNNGGVISPQNGIAAQARTTDARIAQDGDGDGLNNYDEDKYGTSRTESDSDDDGVGDKEEIASWVFPRNPATIPADERGRRPYGFTVDGGNVAGMTFVNPFVDGIFGIGLFNSPPQTDEDTDDGGIDDGEEDLDADGRYENDETDPFWDGDDGILDFVFIVDSTGSMADDIAAVKSNGAAIVDTLIEEFEQVRFGLIEYRDYPPQDNLPSRVVQAFTDDRSTIISALNSLSASGGGDFPESMYTAIADALNGAGIGGWRPEARRAMLIMADAPAHDPEPVSGLTLADIRALASAGGITFGVPAASSGGKDGIGTLVDDRSGPVQINSLLVGGNSSARASLTEVAEETGGTLVTAGGASDVPDAILEVIGGLTANPVAILEVTTPDGGPLASATTITGDLSGSSDPSGCGIRLYEWDWDDDGTFDETTFASIVEHTYEDGVFPGSMRARITTVLDETATASFFISVGDDPDPVIEIESELRLDPQTGLYIQTLTVTNPGTTTFEAVRIFIEGLPENVEVYNASGDVEGIPFIQWNDDIAPGDDPVVMTLEFYIPDRSAPDGLSFTAEVTTRTTVPELDGVTLTVQRIDPVGEVDPTDGETFEPTLEFDATPGNIYFIQYTDDLSDPDSWVTSLPSITAAGTRVRWVDNGPPKTAPFDGMRFYRVVEVIPGD